MNDVIKSNEALKTGARFRQHSECNHLSPELIVRRDRRLRREAKLHKPMRFASLHHHSTYSSLDGFQLPEAHVRRATELNMGTIAMTEHGNVSSHDALEKACKIHGVKAVFGCEVYTGRVGERATQRKYHLTLLATNPVGYRSLIQIVSRAWAEGFYYEPTVSWEMLKTHKEGIVILSGCQGSLLFCSMVGGKLISEGDASYKRATKVARAFKQEFGSNYFIEVQAFPALSKTNEFNPLAEKLSRELGIGLVATMDCHYTVPEEQEIQQVLHNVRGGGRQTLEEQVRNWGYDEYLCVPPTDGEIYRRLRATGLSKLASQQAIINTELIAGGCEAYDLPRLPQLRYPLPPGYDSPLTLWRDWIKAGWGYRRIGKLSADRRREYKERLQYEMKIIEDKDYMDYFLVVSDAVKWAKDNGIPVGPARGSAAASLVCWLLRITEINPMDFPNLVFERFIDVSRQDLPDIDLDFDSDRRHEVREYLVSKYGPGRVNNLGTFNFYKSKNSIDDIARVYHIPKWKIDTLKDLLIERSSGDLRASATILDTVDQFAEAKAVFDEHPELYKSGQLEGNIRGIGVHAAGLVISNGPVTDVCAVYAREVRGQMIEVVSLDKYDAERRGLIKMDFLGLSTMAMIAEGLRQIDMTVTDLYGLPLDDPDVIDAFRKNDVVGVFQFDGRSMRSVNGALKPDSFKEICDVNALSRPGPLHNGAATAYIDTKRGVLQPELIHPALDSITADTHYQIVYQEQILRIVREVGGFDWTHAAYIRKIISQKLGDGEFNRQWDKYWEGAQRLHPDMSEELAQKIWGMCITAGSYAFNAAHTYAYGMLAYWTMWLKVKHPTVFFAASLAKMPDVRTESLLRDADKHNIQIMPPHPKRSGLTWQPERNRIRAGFQQIPGVGPKVATTILDHRSVAGGLSGWDSLKDIKGIGPKTISKIKEFVALDDPFEVRKLARSIAAVIAELEAAGLPLPTHTSLEVPYEAGRDQEVVWIGTIRNKNIRDIFEANRARGEDLDPETVKDPHLNEWAMLVGDDGDELLTLRIDRWLFPGFKKAIFGIKTGHDLVLVRGIKPGYRTARVVAVHQMWVIDPE